MIKKIASNTGLIYVAWLGFTIYVTQSPGKANKKSWLTRPRTHVHE